MAISVEEVSSSLVREYLSRKGLKKTIACMDEEHPRTADSINNRSQLRQILNIETLYKKSKVENSPFKTLLEIIVKYMIESTTDKVNALSVSSPIEINNTEKYVTSCILRSHVDVTKPSQTPLLLADKPETLNQSSLIAHDGKGLVLMASQDTEHFKVPLAESTKRNKTSRIRRGMMPGPVASTPEESMKKKQTQKVAIPQTLPKNEEENCHGDSLSVSHFQLIPQIEKRVQSPDRLKWPNLNVSEMVLDDIDDEEMQSLSKMSLNRTITEQSWTGCPMDQRTATELKVVLLGSSLNCFSVEWRNQGFTFSETHDLRYGIVQKKGGPCGVLASVQGFVLKKLLFEKSDPSNTSNKLRPSNVTRRKCLVLAIAEVLWRAGEQKLVIVAINSGAKHFIPAGQYKSEGVLERIILFTLDNQKNLEDFLDQHIEQFESEVLGCLLLVISAVLSRSIDKVRKDMDVPSTTLIGAHGYCTQELVNLLLCGQAVSNVFDNDVELDSGNGNITLLKGIKDHCEIGFLSLFEHYNICKVGSFLKTPCFPIWVVCSESHFSVLFGLQRELLTSRQKGQEFDLYYYDGLSNQQEEIRLSVYYTVVNMKNLFLHLRRLSLVQWVRAHRVQRAALRTLLDILRPPDHNLEQSFTTRGLGRSALSCLDDATELIPPLEHCIRTRWKDAFVNWNDTEPIL